MVVTPEAQVLRSGSPWLKETLRIHFRPAYSLLSEVVIDEDICLTLESLKSLRQAKDWQCDARYPFNMGLIAFSSYR